MSGLPTTLHERDLIELKNLCGIQGTRRTDSRCVIARKKLQQKTAGSFQRANWRERRRGREFEGPETAQYVKEERTFLHHVIVAVQALSKAVVGANAR